MPKNPLILGILGGIGCVLYTFLFYLYSKEMMLGTFVYWSSLAFYLLAMYQAAFHADISLPPSPIRRRIRAAFLVFLLANLIYYLFYYLFFRFGDPGLSMLQYELVRQNIESGTVGTGQEQLQKWIAETKPEDFEPTIGKTFRSFGQGLIGGFILSAAISYLIQKNN